jgi:hypothetical protein
MSVVVSPIESSKDEEDPTEDQTQKPDSNLALVPHSDKDSHFSGQSEVEGVDEGQCCMHPVSSLGDRDTSLAGRLFLTSPRRRGWVVLSLVILLLTVDTPRIGPYRPAEKDMERACLFQLS